MPVLDHRYFPHLIDLMFAEASPHALFVMRQVCPEWRDKAMRRYTHIDEFSTYRRRGAAKLAPSYVSFRLGRGGPRLRIKRDYEKAVSQLLRHCRILSVGKYAGLSAFRLPQVDTVRFTRCPRYRSSLPPTTTRVIFDDCPAETLTGRARIDKVVFVARPSPLKFLGVRSLPTSAIEVVYIFLGKEETYHDAFRQFQALADRIDMRVTGVNVPLSSKLIHPLSHWTEEAKKIVTLMTLEEYQESIGWEEFAIETNGSICLLV